MKMETVIKIMLILCGLTVAVTIGLMVSAHYRELRAERFRQDEVVKKQLLEQLEPMQHERNRMQAASDGYNNSLIRKEDVEIIYDDLEGNNLKRVRVVNHSDRKIARITGYWDRGQRAIWFADGTASVGTRSTPFDSTFNPPIDVNGQVSIGITPQHESMDFSVFRIGSVRDEKTLNSELPYSEYEIDRLQIEIDRIYDQINALQTP